MPADNQTDVGYAAVPQAATRPVITGVPAVGRTLTRTAGTYTNSPTATNGQWTRAHVDIPGATGGTYVVGTADLGRQIGYYERPTNASGEAPVRYHALRTDRVTTQSPSDDGVLRFPVRTLPVGPKGSFRGFAGDNSVAPVEFGWDFGKYPFYPQLDANGRGALALDPRTLVAASIWSGPTYYVNSARPNDSGDGLTEATALQTLSAAYDRLPATGGVILATGIFDRTKDLIRSNGSVVSLSKPFALIGYGATRPRNGPFQIGLSWAADSGAFITARSAVLRVLDLLNVDAEGDFLDITRRTDAATVNSSDGWFQDGANLRVRRPDGATPSDANTLVLLVGQNVDFPANRTNDAYIENFHLIGGSDGNIRSNKTATGSIVVVDSRLTHAGGLGFVSSSTIYNRNAVAIDLLTGLFAAFRSDASRSGNDAWNFHATGATLLHVLTSDVRGFNVGFTGTTSNNGYTLHENVFGIDVNGLYFAGSGGTVRNIDQSQFWGVNTRSFGDRGDNTLTNATTGTLGDLPPTAAQFDGQAQAWFWGGNLSATSTGLRISSQAKVRFRGPLPITGAVQALGSFQPE